MAKAKAIDTAEAPAKMEGLAKGRIVHYIDDGAVHRAAVITWVWNEEGAVNLFVFDDGVSPLPYPVLRSVRHSEHMEPKTWHFIERA
jgi:hypothetical protein